MHSAAIIALSVLAGQVTVLSTERKLSVYIEAVPFPGGGRPVIGEGELMTTRLGLWDEVVSVREVLDSESHAVQETTITAEENLEITGEGVCSYLTSLDAFNTIDTFNRLFVEFSLCGPSTMNLAGTISCNATSPVNHSSVSLLIEGPDGPVVEAFAESIGEDFVTVVLNEFLILGPGTYTIEFLGKTPCEPPCFNDFAAAIFHIDTLTVSPIDLCLGDLVGEGQVGPLSLGILLAAWGPGPSVADLNCDGEVNGADLGLLIGAWGPCS